MLHTSSPAALADAMMEVREIQPLRIFGGCCGTDGRHSFEGNHADTAPAQPAVLVRLRVSGASRPVEVRLRRLSGESYSAGVHMPPPRDILIKEFEFASIRAPLPVVLMEGISHIIIESDSAFYPLLKDPSAAEPAIQTWCETLSADGLGLMFLDTSSLTLTPLVYIPGSGTVFWENSCASGTSATGMYLASRTAAPIRAARI